VGRGSSRRESRWLGGTGLFPSKTQLAPPFPVPFPNPADAVRQVAAAAAAEFAAADRRRHVAVDGCGAVGLRRNAGRRLAAAEVAADELRRDDRLRHDGGRQQRRGRYQAVGEAPAGGRRRPDRGARSRLMMVARHDGGRRQRRGRARGSRWRRQEVGGDPTTAIEFAADERRRDDRRCMKRPAAAASRARGGHGVPAGGWNDRGCQVAADDCRCKDRR
jgi:hypothetical protein